ncbi:VOC family protein [Paraburkholderia sp. B3]|uniref:VOC family protein n=1 Tax=Paraburkholderia sp. B3 TaxID=3134791 RepID=UPI003982C09B
MPSVDVTSDQLDAMVTFYEAIQSTRCRRRIAMPQAGVHVAVVGSFVLLAGDDATLEPLRPVQAVLTVDSLDDIASVLEAQGAEIVKGIHESAAGGRNLLARHPDGLVTEYYEPAAVLSSTEQTGA